MPNGCILVSGPTIVQDADLVSGLQKDAIVVSNSDNSQVPSLLAGAGVDILLLEIPARHSGELELVRAITRKYPALDILILDESGDSERVAQAFAYGIKDAFRRPYKRELIVERVRAFLRHKNAPAHCRTLSG